jgi:3-dehydroquinate synthetase
MPIAPRRVRVDLPNRGYVVSIGSGILDQVGPLAAEAASVRKGARAFLAHDRLLPESTIRRAEASLQAGGFVAVRWPITATEPEKSLRQLETILGAMAAARMERSEPVVALGGGIVGDLAGFAAAVYRRGVPLIHCPTTLLAMVDASVGGKTGVNLAVGQPGSIELQKNMAGAFHQPRAVLIDVSVLASLSPRHVRSGLAECVKHGMLGADWGDAGLLDWTAANIQAIVALAPEPLTELVTRNVAIKAAVVGRDEREEAPDGGRALLNLGHTFGHAIETLPGLSPDGDPAHAPLQHGEAVSLGLVAATATAVSLGMVDEEYLTQIRNSLGNCGLPTVVQGLPDDESLLRFMGQDKKVTGGRLRLVLPCGRGRAATVSDPTRTSIFSGWAAIRS